MNVSLIVFKKIDSRIVSYDISVIKTLKVVVHQYLIIYIKELLKLILETSLIMKKCDVKFWSYQNLIIRHVTCSYSLFILLYTFTVFCLRWFYFLLSSCRTSFLSTNFYNFNSNFAQTTLHIKQYNRIGYFKNSLITYIVVWSSCKRELLTYKGIVIA